MKREALYKQIVELGHEDLPIICLLFPNEIVGANRAIEGIEIVDNRLLPGLGVDAAPVSGGVRGGNPSGDIPSLPPFRRRGRRAPIRLDREGVLLLLKYILKRLLYLIPVLIGIVFIVFTIMYLSPGDPAKLILGDRAPQEQVDALRQELGLDLPYLQQFWNYIKGLLQGDFGTSYQLRLPVWDVLKLRFPLTLQLTVLTMLFAVVIGMPIGILSAVKQYSVLDACSVVFALLMASIPALLAGNAADAAVFP